MSEPSREHVEAVALAISRVQWSKSERLAVLDAPNWEWVAEDLLTSTDPAVLDAMQDALVRAGRLDWEYDTDVWRPGGDVAVKRLVSDFHDREEGDDA